MSYATVAQLRQYLEQAPTGATTDAFLQTLLDRANAIVGEALGFSFAAYGEAAAKDVQAPYGVTRLLDLPAHEAASVASVYRVSAKATSYEYTTEVTDYAEMDDGWLYRDLGWCPGAWYRVSASWGYEPAPASVVEVELEVAVNIHASRHAGSFGEVVGPEGQGTISVHRALTWVQRDILSAVRTKYLGVTFA